MLRQIKEIGWGKICAGLLVYTASAYGTYIYAVGQKKPDLEGSVSQEQRAAIFDKLATTYDSKIKWDERLLFINRKRSQLLREAKGSVLEVGAGTGRNIYYYPKNIEELTMADQSKAMLKKARETALHLKHPPSFSLKLQVCDVEQLPFPDSSFDTVVDTFGLCSFENPGTLPCYTP